MREIKIEKITLNIGVGEPGEKLENAKVLLERMTGKRSVKTFSKRRIPEWGLRLGVEIGTKVTVRGKEVYELLKRLFKAVDGKVKDSCFDNRGNLSFGIQEYIQVPGMKYDPRIGIIGMNACVTLQRAGYKISEKKRGRSSIGKKHIITKQESIDFFRKNFDLEVISSRVEVE